MFDRNLLQFTQWYNTVLYLINNDNYFHDKQNLKFYRWTRTKNLLKLSSTNQWVWQININGDWEWFSTVKKDNSFKYEHNPNFKRTKICCKIYKYILIVCYNCFPAIVLQLFASKLNEISTEREKKQVWHHLKEAEDGK